MNKAQVLVAFVIVLLAAAIVFAVYALLISNLDSYSVQMTGYCFSSDEVDAALEGFLELGNGKRRIGELEKALEALDGVEDASVKARLSGQLDVSIVNADPGFLLTVNENGITSFFEIKAGKVVGFGQEKELPYQIEITPEFMDNLIAFGPNGEFFEVLHGLEPLLDDKSLKITIKYANNMSGKLGWLVVDFPSCDAVISVKEKVSPRRLEAALRIVEAQTEEGEGHQAFDLYADSLVKRG
ncbi:MAG: hypothetical protein WC117_06310 [Sphaerochaetaceae bacterium]|jgi:hypothetical protein